MTRDRVERHTIVALTRWQSGVPAPTPEAMAYMPNLCDHLVWLTKEARDYLLTHWGTDTICTRCAPVADVVGVQKGLIIGRYADPVSNKGRRIDVKL